MKKLRLKFFGCVLGYCSIRTIISLAIFSVGYSIFLLCYFSSFPNRTPMNSQEMSMASPEILAKLSVKRDVTTLTSKPRRILGTSSFHIIEVNDNNLTYYDIEKIHGRMVTREDRAEYMCRLEVPTMLGSSSEKGDYERIEVDVERGTLYCPLLKVGSTFWRRVFYAIRTNLTIFTPYDVTILRALKGKRDNLKSMLPINGTHTKHFLDSALTIMFVREPYSRLLSGYVDKLFAPNPYFWQHVGRYIIKHYRTNPSTKSLRCGHDVTFPEFIQYVVDTKQDSKQRDAHFTPTYDQCKPCEIKYNTIGHMETFNEDTAYIFNALGYNISRNSLKLWASKFEEDAIRDSTYSPFGWKKRIVKCMPFEEALRRIWHKLQLRGVVRKHVKYSHMIKAKNIRNLISSMKEHGWADSEKTAKKLQKQETLQGAYAMIPKTDLDKIRTIFKNDFHMYGYDAYSKSIFPNKALENNWVFDISKCTK